MLFFHMRASRNTPASERVSGRIEFSCFNSFHSELYTGHGQRRAASRPSEPAHDPPRAHGLVGTLTDFLILYIHDTVFLRGSSLVR